MRGADKDDNFPVIVTLCGSCGCGCPTVMEGSSPEDLVIVGKLDAAVLNSEAVKKHTGEGEIAVVIPKRLLMEAAKALT